MYRACCKLDRLVVVGHSGYVTLDAIRWLDDAGIGLIHLDANGRALTTSTSLGVKNAPLRRAQALAVGNGIGIAIIRHLLRAKIEGQAAVVSDLDAADVAERLAGEFCGRLDGATTLDELPMTEAGAANLYWDAWNDFSVNYPHYP